VSFDAIAPWYRALEWIAFGNDLQRCRIACLGEIESPRRVLIVGEGNGRFLCKLLRAYPNVEVDCLDASARMLRLAEERICAKARDDSARVHFLHDDATSWSAPERHYDLVVTHFVLDCFPEVQLAGIIEKLARAATDDASWLLADFCIPARGFAKLRARTWLAIMYKFFRVTAGIQATRLRDPSPFVQAQGFALAKQHQFKNGMLKSEAWRR